MRFKWFLGLAFITFALFAFNFSFSASGDNVSGWAWSDNIGWISFNCTDTNSCATSPYGVNLNTSTGYFSGYAWSDNIGWVNMAPAGSYPTGGGTVSDRAKLVGGNVVGWARACAVFRSGCDGSLRPANENGGWDGWISMGGTATDGSPYGVTLDGNAFKNFAWGSDIVGWMQWNPAFGGVFLTAQCGNNIVDTGEQCDDGNAVSGDGCSSSCQNEISDGGGGGGENCGNNVVEIGEQCDDGNTANGDGCSSQCALENPQLCGNSNTDPGEQCDDGNTTDGDGCSATCQTETANSCGNHVIDQGEDCDFTSGGDPIFRSGDSCSVLGFSGGTLGCTSTCTLNLTQCTQYQCSNGTDDDGDGLIDANDPGCCSTSDDSETGTCSTSPAQCNDGRDNDGDGKIDFNPPEGYERDPGCTGPNDNSEFNVNPPGGEI